MSINNIIQIIGSSLNNLGVDYTIENPINDYDNRYFELVIQIDDLSIVFVYQSEKLLIKYSFEQSFTNYNLLQQIQIDFGSIKQSIENHFATLSR